MSQNRAAVHLMLFGLGIAPMSIAAMAQESQLPPCDSKSPRRDNCQGSRQYAKGLFVGDEEKYVGEDGKPNGQGTLTLPNGEKFVGEFKDGKLKVTVPNGGVESFLEFKDGKLKLILPDGVEYEFLQAPLEEPMTRLRC
jgi:hypothetical protein